MAKVAVDGTFPASSSAYAMTAFSSGANIPDAGGIVSDGVYIWHISYKGEIYIWESDTIIHYPAKSGQENAFLTLGRVIFDGWNIWVLTTKSDGVMSHTIGLLRIVVNSFSKATTIDLSFEPTSYYCLSDRNYFGLQGTSLAFTGKDLLVNIDGKFVRCVDVVGIR